MEPGEVEIDEREVVVMVVDVAVAVELEERMRRGMRRESRVLPLLMLELGRREAVLLKARLGLRGW